MFTCSKGQGEGSYERLQCLEVTSVVMKYTPNHHIRDTLFVITKLLMVKSNVQQICKVIICCYYIKKTLKGTSKKSYGDFFRKSLPPY